MAGMRPKVLLSLLGVAVLSSLATLGVSSMLGTATNVPIVTAQSSNSVPITSSTIPDMVAQTNPAVASTTGLLNLNNGFLRDRKWVGIRVRSESRPTHTRELFFCQADSRDLIKFIIKQYIS